jgi:hypothetical protein
MDEMSDTSIDSFLFEKEPLLSQYDDYPDPFDEFDIYDQDKIKHKNLGKLGVITFSAMIMLGSAYITKYL